MLFKCHLSDQKLSSVLHYYLRNFAILGLKDLYLEIALWEIHMLTYSKNSLNDSINDQFLETKAYVILAIEAANCNPFVQETRFIYFHPI